MIAYLLLASLLIPIVGGIAAVVIRRRRPPSFEEGMTSFRKGLDALDPANDPLKRKSR